MAYVIHDCDDCPLDCVGEREWCPMRRFFIGKPVVFIAYKEYCDDYLDTHESDARAFDSFDDAKRFIEKQRMVAVEVPPQSYVRSDKLMTMLWYDHDSEVFEDAHEPVYIPFADGSREMLDPPDEFDPEIARCVASGMDARQAYTSNILSPHAKYFHYDRMVRWYRRSDVTDTAVATFSLVGDPYVGDGRELGRRVIWHAYPYVIDRWGERAEVRWPRFWWSISVVEFGEKLT